MSYLQIYAFRARFIQSTLGNRTAAGYLRNRNVELSDAVKILATRKPIA